MDTDAARDLADRFGEYAQSVWTDEVSDVEWDQDLDGNIRTSIERVLEALVPDGEPGLVKSSDGPLAPGQRSALPARNQDRACRRSQRSHRQDFATTARTSRSGRSRTS